MTNENVLEHRPVAQYPRIFFDVLDHSFRVFVLFLTVKKQRSKDKHVVLIASNKAFNTCYYKFRDVICENLPCGGTNSVPLDHLLSHVCDTI